ncbi:MAG: TlpA family protein disulfide reductase [Gammaproteobacteria bacterium]|nr:TlpA family protein disulfide reductase [Gammaproteobacteria bacterium]
MKCKLLIFALLCTFVFPGHAVDMDLENIDGSKQNLSDFEGKWVVVNFWATWCPPCIAEMPDLQQFHDNHVNKDAMVIGINVENLGNSELNTFLDMYFITYPIFRGPQMTESELGTIPGLPTTFLVSPQGTVEARQVGSVTAEMIENFIVKWEARQLVLQ